MNVSVVWTLVDSALEFSYFISTVVYEYFHDGECLPQPSEPECNESSCPEEEKPICAHADGSSGEPRTFFNECYLKVYNAFNPDARECDTHVS